MAPERLESVQNQLQRIEAMIPELSDAIMESSTELLANTAMLLARAANMDAVLTAILDGLKEIVPYDAAGIFLVREDKKTIESQVVRGYRLEKLDRVHQKINEGIIGLAISRAEIVNAGDVGKFPQYISARSATRSEMAAPIISGEEVIGCINLESDKLDAFTPADIRLVEHLAGYAAVAVEREQFHLELVSARQVERELQIARRIQIALLPHQVPTIAGYDLAGLNVPSREVGGDYYDFIPITFTDIGLVIADVAGKGVPAGLIMSGLRGALRTRVETTFQISNILTSVNRFLCESTGAEAFVTAFYGVLDTIQGQLTYINAGHESPILLKNDGHVSRLQEGGPLLGVITDAHYEMAITRLEPGSILLLFTDGIVEAGGEAGMELGVERVQELLKALSQEPAMVIAREIEREAMRWNPNPAEMDDRTVMVVKRL